MLNDTNGSDACIEGHDAPPKGLHLIASGRADPVLNEDELAVYIVAFNAPDLTSSINGYRNMEAANLECGH